MGGRKKRKKKKEEGEGKGTHDLRLCNPSIFPARKPRFGGRGRGEGEGGGRKGFNFTFLAPTTRCWMTAKRRREGGKKTEERGGKNGKPL